jgi:hypothetical protein
MPSPRIDVDPQVVSQLYLDGSTTTEIAAKFDTSSSVIRGRLEGAGIARRTPGTQPDPSRRFWRKVNKNGPIPPHAPELGPCWEWTGRLATGEFKYGVFILAGKEVRAHRFAFELAHGPIPETMCVLHACDNPKCVRHLFLGSKADNNLDRDRKGRQAWGERQAKAKLTYQEADTIRWSHRTGGLPLTVLARWYEVSVSTIARVVSNEGWIEPQAA